VLLEAGAGTFGARTESIGEAVDHYFSNGFNTRDVRVQRGAPLLIRGEGVIIDQDFLTPEQMRDEPVYAECFFPHRLGWFAAIGIRLYGSLWSLAIQRTLREGPFESEHKCALAKLSQPLTEVAMLSAAVGRTALAGATSALQSVRLPAIAIDRRGHVLDANFGVEGVLDESLDLKGKRLRAVDPGAQQQLDKLFERLFFTSDKESLPAEPIVVRRQNKAPIIIQVLPVPCAARNPFLGARALLTFATLAPKSALRPTDLMRVFGLSPAEARLASIIAEGTSPEHAAERLRIARETARNQLKAIFGKTGTHRQGELVALLGAVKP
jgi:DNA-binding CsgD family transcriptional regulator